MATVEAMGRPQAESSRPSSEDPFGPPSPRRPMNVRGHRRQTERHLIVGGFVIMFLVGGGLIWHFYGAGAVLMAWFFMGGGVALFAGLYAILKLMERWSRGGD